MQRVAERVYTLITCGYTAHEKYIFYEYQKRGVPAGLFVPKVKIYKLLFFHAPYRGGGVQNGFMRIKYNQKLCFI